MPRRTSLVFTLPALAVLHCPGAAQADDVDIAVEAFAAGGHLVGVSVGPTEKKMVKSLVRCGIAQSKPIGDCAREEIVRKLPQEAQPLARCLLENKTIEVCARSEIVSRALVLLPPQTRQGGHGPLAFGSDAHLVNIAGHAAVGCGSAVASGGKCGPDAASGAAGSFAGPLMADMGFHKNVVAHAVVGGLAS